MGGIGAMAGKTKKDKCPRCHPDERSDEGSAAAFYCQPAPNFRNAGNPTEGCVSGATVEAPGFNPAIHPLAITPALAAGSVRKAGLPPFADREPLYSCSVSRIRIANIVLLVVEMSSLIAESRLVSARTRHPHSRAPGRCEWRAFSQFTCRASCVSPPNRRTNVALVPARCSFGAPIQIRQLNRQLRKPSRRPTPQNKRGSSQDDPLFLPLQTSLLAAFR